MKNILDYARTENRSFLECPVNDVDLLVLSAAMYFEFERFQQFLEADESIVFSSFPAIGDISLFGEHDYYPRETTELATALATSKRFGSVPVEHFECIVQSEPAMQFGAACMPLAPDCVVVAYRGTDITYEGWQEGFEMTFREAGPGQIAALGYLHRAAVAYPNARLYVCGHSKGGTFAEYAALLADDDLSKRIARASSFDGPGLFRCGGPASLDLAAYDIALAEHYDSVNVPIVRYIFPSAVGLLFEKRAPEFIFESEKFSFVQPCASVRGHNVFSVGIEGCSFAMEDQSLENVRDGLGSARFLQAYSVEERAFAARVIIEACSSAGVTIDLSDKGMQEMFRALVAWYRNAARDERRKARLLIAKTIKTAALNHGANR